MVASLNVFFFGSLLPLQKHLRRWSDRWNVFQFFDKPESFLVLTDHVVWKVFWHKVKRGWILGHHCDLGIEAKSSSAAHLQEVQKELLSCVCRGFWSIRERCICRPFASHFPLSIIEFLFTSEKSHLLISNALTFLLAFKMYVWQYGFI